MADHIDLTCGECTRSFSMPRCRGLYPTRCPDCQERAGRERDARRLARKARKAGIQARAYQHGRLGWVCLACSPWHEHPVALRDTLDIAYMAVELGLSTRDPHGHPATRSPTGQRILELHADGVKATEIARIVGCTPAWVYVIRARATEDTACAA